MSESIEERLIKLERDVSRMLLIVERIGHNYMIEKDKADYKYALEQEINKYKQKLIITEEMVMRCMPLNEDIHTSSIVRAITNEYGEIKVLYNKVYQIQQRLWLRGVIEHTKERKGVYRRVK